MFLFLSNKSQQCKMNGILSERTEPVNINLCIVQGLVLLFFRPIFFLFYMYFYMLLMRNKWMHGWMDIANKVWPAHCIQAICRAWMFKYADVTLVTLLSVPEHTDTCVVPICSRLDIFCCIIVNTHVLMASISHGHDMRTVFCFFLLLKTRTYSDVFCFIVRISLNFGLPLVYTLMLTFQQVSFSFYMYTGTVQ